MDAISQTIFFEYIFLNENVWIAIKISLKFGLKGSINNKQYSNIGLENGLAPSRLRAIIWTNGG